MTGMSENENKKTTVDLRDADFSSFDREASVESGRDMQNGGEACDIDSGSGSDSSGGSSDGNDSATSAHIKALEAEVAEFKDKYLRALAEVENIKKRAAKDRSELLKYQGDKILADMLEIADNLERAVAGAAQDPASLAQGVPLILKLFMDTLGKWDVRPESGIGKPFDPYKFRAISRVFVDDAAPGTIINELRKTYFYKDKLLRAGEVVVAAEPESPKSDGAA